MGSDPQRASIGALFEAFGSWIGIKSGTTILDFFNSQGLATIVQAIVAIIVGMYAKKTGDAATAEQEARIATQQAQIIEDEVLDVSKAPEIDLDVGDYRAECRGLIARTKAYLDERVQDDGSSRNQRTYKAVGRYDYVALAIVLHARQKISREQLPEVVSQFSAWKSYERGKAASKPVPRAVYDTLRSAHDNLVGAAPSIFALAS
jgi:hypothetical protein